MREIDTLIYARWIIPVEPHGTVLDNYCIAVNEGKIIELLPQRQVTDRFHARHTLRLDDHALIPGLINCHTHAAMTLLRGLADDLPLMDWLKKHIWPAEERWVNEEFVQHGTQLAIAEMLRGGITCFNDMYFFPDVTARTSASAGMRACVGLIVLDFPTVWAGNADEYLSKGLDLHDHYRSDPLITTALAPHAPYTVSDEPLRRIGVLADELDVPIHIHVHETAQEIQDALQHTGKRPLQRLQDLGLLSPSLLAVHMTQLQDREIELCAEFGAKIVHCPESNLKLASGFSPVHKLNEAGITVAIGTDGAASNNDLDMLGEMRTTALLAKAVAEDASALPARQVLRMATLNGAIALGLGESIGSLEAGKWADITAIQLNGVEATPCYDPISQLVYATGRNQVTDVWVEGRHLLKDRQLTTLDTTEILQHANVWRKKILRSDPAGELHK